MKLNGKLLVAAREFLMVGLVSTGFLIVSISSAWAVFLGMTLVSAGFITGAAFRTG